MPRYRPAIGALTMSLSSHIRAIDRHADWARDFALVGDLESAVEELKDLAALASELGLCEPGGAIPRSCGCA
jgi:hypothetical protein